MNRLFQAVMRASMAGWLGAATFGAVAQSDSQLHAIASEFPSGAGAAHADAATAALHLTQPTVVSTAAINTGDTAWVITASCLVLLMTIPGLALFYAGMVRKKNIIATLMQTLAVCALVTVLWFALGYSLAFTPGSGFSGGFSAAGLASLVMNTPGRQVSVSHLAPHVPEAVYVMFQLTFAIITPALIAGAFAERMRFSMQLGFMALWSLLVYAPIAHWVWEPTGWLAEMGVLDYAGGTVVHINAGAAGLVAAYMVGPRIGYGREALIPSNLGYAMIGASLLWVGWMGFNGGSALAADGRAGFAMLATQLSAAAAAMSWMAAEWLRKGKPTLLGLSTGVVAGLVAITPASGYVTPMSAVLIGLISGAVCYWGVTGLKRVIGADDSLDVFGVHGVGGLLGALLTGVLASPQISGSAASLATQAIAAFATFCYSGFMTFFILAMMGTVTHLRVPSQHELRGLDLSLHGERVE